MNPLTRAAGCFAFMRSIMATAAASTAVGDARPRTTPPTSDLCVISGDRIFSTTGAFMRSARWRASVGVAAMTSLTAGTP